MQSSNYTDFRFYELNISLFCPYLQVKYWKYILTSVLGIKLIPFLHIYTDYEVSYIAKWFLNNLKSGSWGWSSY
jgi:hypothetical protein